jgi:phenylacetic acid degradation operon negative regulatory protein
MPTTPHAALQAATRRVLRRFRAQRPLRAGSLLVTIFGDAIAPRGGAVSLASLITLAAPFGLTERLVRTSAARLASDGWLQTRRAGRRSEYRLSVSGAARFREATQRIYGAAPAHWDGRWTLLLLPPAGAAPLRQALRWQGFGQLGASVFAHPSAGALSTPVARTALQLESRGSDAHTNRRLVERGWDLAELARAYRRFVRDFAPLATPLAQGTPSAEQAFVLRTLLIHEYRKVHLRDPLLPAVLLPRNWVGSTAYELCRTLYAQLYAPAEGYLSASAERLRGPLPRPSAGAAARFGTVLQA